MKMKWISAKNELPLPDIEVLLFVESPYLMMRVAFISASERGWWSWRTYDDEFNSFVSKKKITHWMPLPSFPE